MFWEGWFPTAGTILSADLRRNGRREESRDFSRHTVSMTSLQYCRGRSNVSNNPSTSCRFGTIVRRSGCADRSNYAHGHEHA